MPKRKQGAAVEEPQTKRRHSDGVSLPEEIVVDIIGYLPLLQIFSLHTLSKSINNALKDPTQTLWKRLVKQNWKSHNNDNWNEVVDYGEENEKFKEEKAPFLSVMGSFCSREKLTTEEVDQQWIKEASNEKCRLLVQTWAIIEIWTNALFPLFYPDSNANMEPRMYPFYLWPDSHDDDWFFEQLTKTINEDCEADPLESTLECFHEDVMDRIKEIFEENGGKEPNLDNFPKGSKAKWEQFPSLFWENTKWTAMENPFTSWNGGEIGPWESMYKLFWGQRKDNYIVGFITIIDNN
mgnify:CR=1 FL=1